MTPAKLAVCSIFLAIWALSTQAQTKAEKKTVAIGFVEMPPFTYTADNGEPAGVLNELSRRVLNQLGYKVRFTGYPPKRMIKFLVSGEIDLVQTIKSIPRFQGNAWFSDRALHRITLNVYARQGTTAVTRAEDLNGHEVLIMRGYSYGGLIEYLRRPANAISLFRANHLSSAFAMLAKGRGDYLLSYHLPSHRLFEKRAYPGLHQATLRQFPVHWVLSKNSDFEPELLAAMERVHEALPEATLPAQPRTEDPSAGGH